MIQFASGCVPDRSRSWCTAHDSYWRGWDRPCVAADRRVRWSPNNEAAELYRLGHSPRCANGCVCR